jgi:hypothetical protein
MRRARRVVWPAAVLAAALTAIGFPAAGVQAGTGGAASATDPLLPPAPDAIEIYTTLNSVYCTSAADCWAVGQQASGSALLNQVLHWDGRKWTRTVAPNPGGTTGISQLFAVRCLGPADCWAVGDYVKHKAFLAEALHWNGRTWSATSVPAPGGTVLGDLTELFDSTCTSASSCWAVGDYGVGPVTAEKAINLVLHWNGKKWTRTATPNPAGIRLGDVNGLSAVRCLSATDCNAVGEYGQVTMSSYKLLNETLHWNGRHWSWVHAPDPGGTKRSDVNELIALGCGSATSCWAAGLSGVVDTRITYLNEILHWNGKSWARARTPQPGGTKSGAANILLGAVCSAASDCWAVGDYAASGDAVRDQALHWNGRHWTLVPTPSPAGTSAEDSNTLDSVRCVSGSDCWAVGGSETGGHSEIDQILHWNGKKWSIWK